MKARMVRKKYVEMLGLFGVGILLICIALLLDPIGSSPDTGVIELRSTGAKQLLGFLGVIFVVCGFVVFARRSRNR